MAFFAGALVILGAIVVASWRTKVKEERKQNKTAHEDLKNSPTETHEARPEGESGSDLEETPRGPEWSQARAARSSSTPRESLPLARLKRAREAGRPRGDFQGFGQSGG
eukprot:CAMPEP_0171263160 /NCGR_PEP_ID=MMETSP0790-20130122/56950_1 /TAXON_ID=2925 /ORGANISM="Alexandrium catenella, Strain OF101" /LENGTH=108 /DNA_ID=CAMNT_0011731757 /DNA_START=70 /DNA_END=393 /DNA_ORIENTATION=+